MRTAPAASGWAALGRLLARPGLRVIRGEQRSRLRAAWEDIVARERALDDRIFLGIVGGTGVGKSTLINAIAGASISRAGDRRPTTDRVVVYRHSGSALPEDFPREDLAQPEAIHEERGLERLVVLDFPDFDSVEADHASILARLLPRLDVLMVVVDDEKYADLRLFQLLNALPQAAGNLHFVFNKVDRLQERYSARWTGVAGEILEDFRAKLSQHAGIRAERERLRAISARAALARRGGGDGRGSDGGGAAEGDFPAVLEVLESYQAEKRRRAAKEANLEALKAALAAEAADLGLAPAAGRKCAAARRALAGRRVELDRLLAATDPDILGELSRRGISAAALERCGAGLALMARALSRLLGAPRKAGLPRPEDLAALARARYLPFRESLRSAERELGRAVESVAGAVEEAPPASGTADRATEATHRKTHLAQARELEGDLERGLRRALRFRRLRSFLLPLFLIAAGLWFFLHPLIAAVAKDLAEGRPIDWGEFLRRAAGALVVALSPFAIVAFLAFVLLVYLLTFLLDWRRVRRAVDAALESFHRQVRAEVEEEMARSLARLSAVLDAWEKEREELSGAVGAPAVAVAER